MSYSPELSSVLKSLQASNGDLLRVISSGREHVGTLMPHHDFSDPDVLVLKLKSGYNIGIKVSADDDVSVLERAARREPPRREKPAAEGRKRVAIIGTGGTIASYADYRTGAVHPALSAEDLAASVPEMADLAYLDPKVLFSIFSENMEPRHWQELAVAVSKELNDGAEAVIIPHGTDTMGYTAAALSFMLGEIPRPVILVGSQRSSDRPSSDAYSNLMAALRFALEQDVAEVCVLMHSGPSDDEFAVHFGTRVRKMHSSRRDAFRSMNVPPLAQMKDCEVEFNAPCRRKSDVEVTPSIELQKDVLLLQYYPGMHASQFSNLIGSARGVVMSGTGLGHVNRDMVGLISRAVYGGTEVVMTTQCLSGATNLGVYDTGRDLINAGVITVMDMLPETAYVKLMWAMANSDDVRRTMTTPLQNEMGERREMHV